MRREQRVTSGVIVHQRRQSPPHGRSAMPRTENGQIVETAIEARGGVLGMPVLYVLMAGTAGVIVLFVAVYLFAFT